MHETVRFCRNWNIFNDKKKVSKIIDYFEIRTELDDKETSEGNVDLVKQDNKDSVNV